MISRAALNTTYHLAGLPLATLSFVLVITGLATGAGLSVVWIGAPILAATLRRARRLADADRRLADSLLAAGIGPAAADLPAWRCAAFLLVRLPLSVVSLAVTAALLAGGVVLTGAPVSYGVADVALGSWAVDSFARALAVAPLGLALLALAAYVATALGALQAAVARALLAPRTPGVPAAPAPGLAA